jgi:hypothetical protein
LGYFFFAKELESYKRTPLFSSRLRRRPRAIFTTCI